MSQTHPSRSVLVFGWSMALLPMVALLFFTFYVLGTLVVATVWYSSPIVLVTQTTEGQLLERRVLKAKWTSGELAPWGRQEQWDAEGNLVKSVPFFLSSNRLHGRIFDRLNRPDRAMLTPGSLVFSGHVIELQPNGVLASTANFRDGKLHGVEITRHPDGRIATKGNYVAGNREGLWQEWNASGMFVVRGTYLAGLKNSWWDEWDDAGVLRRSVDMLDELPCGWSIEWRSDGTIASKCVYAEGKKHGQWEEWREDGKLASRGTYVWDQQTGQWEYWNERGLYIRAVNLLSGVPSGEERVWFGNGNLASCGSYTNGQRTGRWEIWYPSGVLQRTVELANDSTRNGEEIIWHENGQMASRGSYIANQKNGDWDYWTEDGIHIRREQWTEGVPDGEWLTFHAIRNAVSRVVYQLGEVVKPWWGAAVYDGTLEEYVQKKAERREVIKKVILGAVCIFGLIVWIAIFGPIIAAAFRTRPKPQSHTTPRPQSHPQADRGSTSRPFGSENWAAFSCHRDATPDNVNLLSVSKAICDGQHPPGSLISSGREIRRWDPRVDAPDARMIPDTPSAYRTPDGTILNNSGSILGSVDLVTGDVRLSNGRLLNDNVKGITDPSEAAARAYTIIDNDGC